MMDLESMLSGSGMDVAALGAMLFVVLVVALIAYVFYGFAMMTILKKIKYHTPWLAWIPIANVIPALQVGGFHWAWVFLALIPILGWIPLMVLVMIGMWKIYEKRKYPGWLVLIPLAAVLPVVGDLAGIANLIVLGLVAWKDR